MHVRTVSSQPLCFDYLRRCSHLLEENIDLAKYGQSAEAVSDYDDEEEAEEEDEEEDSEGPTDYKALLTKLYTKHNPEKLAQIDEILEKYAGNEDDIIQGIKEKYEETETTEPAVNEPVWKESAPNELEIMARVPALPPTRVHAHAGGMFPACVWMGGEHRTWCGSLWRARCV